VLNPTLLLQQLLNGLAIGGVYAIFAVGYTLIFSVLRIVNFAQGAVFTLGAYFTYALTGSQFGFNGLLANAALPLRLPFIAALLGGALLAGGCGVVIERLAFRPLRARNADPLLSLVSSLGVAVALVNVIQYLFGAEMYAYPADPFGKLPPAVNFGSATQPIPVRTVQVIIFGVSIVMVAALSCLMNRTRTGKALRAVAEDTVTASLLGINTDRLIVLTFFVSGFLGGVAGTLVGLSVSIAGPYFGIAFGLKGLSVIVLGGLGDIPGAIVGGFVIGLAEALVPSQYIAYRDAVPFALLFVVLLVRPQGILGRVAIQKV
jgi:branched-chain amino acid transport system permease protein